MVTVFPQHSRPPNFHGTGTPGPTYLRRQHPHYQISCVSCPTSTMRSWGCWILGGRDSEFTMSIMDWNIWIAKKNTCYIWYVHTIQLCDTVIGATDTWILWLLTSGSVPMRAAKLWANCFLLKFQVQLLKKTSLNWETHHVDDFLVASGHTCRLTTIP